MERKHCGWSESKEFQVEVWLVGPNKDGYTMRQLRYVLARARRACRGLKSRPEFEVSREGRACVITLMYSLEGVQRHFHQTEARKLAPIILAELEGKLSGL